MKSFNIGQTLRGRNALYTIITQLRKRPEGPWLATYAASFFASRDPFPNLYEGSKSGESSCEDRPYKTPQQ